MNKFLISDKYIDWKTPLILSRAKKLKCSSEFETVKSCFEFVRDEIKHSNDYKLNPITVKASDVLKYKTGYCYAKSHLLCALLRANNIPTGLCYQRLTVNDDGSGSNFCLHGLNAVFLENIGWYRIDARGNKEGVNAEFNPPTECLAFPIRFEGEKDLPKVYVKPLDVVIEVLEKYSSYEEVASNLPDIELI